VSQKVNLANILYQTIVFLAFAQAKKGVMAFAQAKKGVMAFVQAKKGFMAFA